MKEIVKEWAQRNNYRLFVEGSEPKTLLIGIRKRNPGKDEARESIRDLIGLVKPHYVLHDGGFEIYEPRSKTYLVPSDVNADREDLATNSLIRDQYDENTAFVHNCTLVGMELSPTETLRFGDPLSPEAQKLSEQAFLRRATHRILEYASKGTRGIISHMGAQRANSISEFLKGKLDHIRVDQTLGFE